MSEIVGKEEYLKSLFKIIRGREPSDVEAEYLLNKYNSVNTTTNLTKEEIISHIQDTNNPHNVTPNQQDSVDYTLIFNNNLI